MKTWAGRTLLIVAWIATMTVSLGAGAYGHKNRARIRALIRSVQADPAITTNLYTLRIEKLTIPAEGRDGGIARFGSGILLVNRFGHFWYVDSAKVAHRLKADVPVNMAEFNADPFNRNTLYTDLFGVKDIAIQQTATGIRVLASHSHWNTEGRCNTLRVSALETTEQSLLGGTADAAAWRTLYETTPCRPLEAVGSDKQRLGLGVGGRVVPLADGSVLVTIGGFDPDNELVQHAPQTLDNSYGKTILIEPGAGTSRIFTIGHRNPQGLAAASDGSIWLTEHAARGGDELNRLADARNFGYPLVAYGTQYESMTWPLSAQQGRHDGFDKPMFAWVPSIGISQLVVLEQNAFPYWRGDIIVSSLAAESLFRVRVEDDRAIFVEPIPIGHRIRDIVEARDGAIVLKTDDNFLVYITPLDASTAATPVERGAVLAAMCQACHSLGAEGNIAIGPGLWGIVGRPIAAQEGFVYTESLRAVGGRWTRERLQSFLADPNGFAAGTTMQLTMVYDSAQIADLIAYLQTLR